MYTRIYVYVDITLKSISEMEMGASPKTNIYVPEMCVKMLHCANLL